MCCFVVGPLYNWDMYKLNYAWESYIYMPVTAYDLLILKLSTEEWYRKVFVKDEERRGGWDVGVGHG